MIKLQKHEIRKQLRQKRRHFVGPVRQEAELAISQRITELIKADTQNKLVGAYIAFDGEVDLSRLWGGGLPLVRTCQGHLQNRLVFPVHQPNQPLTFVRPHDWDTSGALPIAHGEMISCEQISLLLVPGVAFQRLNGFRLGLGGGHYDRTLARRDQHSWRLRAFGVGFTFQEREELPIEPWDIPLDGFISERGTHVINDNIPPTPIKPLDGRETH